MAKTAKAATQKTGKSRDLFSDLPEAAPRRLSGKATRSSKPTRGGDSDAVLACTSAAPTKRRCITCLPR
jgi:hypothetical protein